MATFRAIIRFLYLRGVNEIHRRLKETSNVGVMDVSIKCVHGCDSLKKADHHVATNQNNLGLFILG
jgi:hypothetical protein